VEMYRMRQQHLTSGVRSSEKELWMPLPRLVISSCTHKLHLIKRKSIDNSYGHCMIPLSTKPTPQDTMMKKVRVGLIYTSAATPIKPKTARKWASPYLFRLPVLVISRACSGSKKTY
jgi:hypothetical protein